ncbi:30S ribosomal protein S2 [Spiroplasma gladiatoris]|uniref:Small ribosomal subunit protein uS2 n=1 Tax=Spiroplasma gladiatoris TaxID=2143 RepID=A0A4P7AIK5_9MOLU|nr:30S ribosomal protein S2 [Spiroplasma gladiatoris]QBQ07476.1 30S ribosomal protein S2 [Spiroplasma gladiatoris]
MAKDLTRDQLWDAGAHFGHQTKRWNPKMKPYIYGEKNKNHVIDLQKTLRKLEDVKKLVTSIGTKKEKIIFVGTKKTARNAVKEAALRSGNFFVNSRWLGGTLTNMKTISLRIKALWDIENEEKTGKINLRPKKEQILIKKEKAKLEKTLGGIKQMHKLPAAMFVIDPKNDEIAVKEARKLRIPIIGICDTNVDPDLVDFVIPANDDIQESINIIINYVVDVYGDAAGLKLQPSSLKVVAQKREENQQNQRYGDSRPQRRFDDDHDASKKAAALEDSKKSEASKKESE